MILACIALAITSSGWLFDLVGPSVGRWLNVGRPLTEVVDCVYVLGGHDDSRSIAAAAILNRHLSSLVLIPRVPGGDSLAELSHGELIRRMLLAEGVRAEAIIEVDRLVNSTSAEADAVAEWIQRHQLHSLAVVTNDFHARRSRSLFRRALAGHQIELHLVSVPTDGYGPDDWWQTENGIQAYLSELAKLTFHSLTGR